MSQILERSIKLLFETRDISQVKQFVQRQCVKVLDGRASMQDLTFAKEYRGSGSYRPGACVPALELTRCVCVETLKNKTLIYTHTPTHTHLCFWDLLGIMTFRVFIGIHHYLNLVNTRSVKTNLPTYIGIF